MARSSTWIINTTLLTQNSRRDVLRGNLHIVDGHVAEITTRKPRVSSQSTLLSGEGLTILPGFVQAHVHLCQTLFRNQADDLELLDWLSKKIWRFEAAHTEETLYWSARLGIHELLSSGTTCILDMGTVRHTNSILEAVKETGIRASVGKCLMDRPSHTPPYLREKTDAALNEAVELYSKWNGKEGDRIRISYAPRFVLSCTEELLKEVARLSREQKAVVHTHCSENPTEVAIIRDLVGEENVTYLKKIGMTSERLVLAHGIWLSKKEKQILKSSGTHIVHCPSSNLKLASGIADVPGLRKLGVNVALGADGAPCNNNLNMFNEMRLAALIHKPGAGPRAMRALEVLDMATRDGAKALNWEDKIGSIEVGKKADLVAIDLEQVENLSPHRSAEEIASSVVYSTQPHHVKWTMVDGSVVYDHRRPSTAKLLTQVARAQQLILNQYAGSKKNRWGSISSSTSSDLM